MLLQRSIRYRRGFFLGVARQRQQQQMRLQTPMRCIATGVSPLVTNPSTSVTIATTSSSLSDVHTNTNTNYTARRWKSLAQQVRSKPLANVRKQLWEFYFSTGRGASALFEVIDLKETGFLKPKEVQAFITEVLSYEENGKTVRVDPREIMPYAWNILEKRELEKKNYDIREFKKWLVAATKMSADTKNSRLMEYLAANPNVGENSYLSDAEEVDPVFTWNEETMSQSLRRMQYAVRGEVVMKADQLAAQGKDILYTNIGNPHQVGQSPITDRKSVV